MDDNLQKIKTALVGMNDNVKALTSAVSESVSKVTPGAITLNRRKNRSAPAISVISIGTKKVGTTIGLASGGTIITHSPRLTLDEEAGPEVVTAPEPLSEPELDAASIRWMDLTNEEKDHVADHVLNNPHDPAEGNFNWREFILKRREKVTQSDLESHAQ